MPDTPSGTIFPDPTRDEWRGRWLESCWAALWDAQPPVPAPQLAWARAVAAAAVVDDRFAVADPCRARRLRAGPPDGLPLDPGPALGVWTALAARGMPTRRISTPNSGRDDPRPDALRTCERSPQPARGGKDEAWRAALEDPGLRNDQLDAVHRRLRGRRSPRLIGSYDDGYFAALRDVWATRSIEIARRIVLGLFPSSESLDPVDAWLTANTDAPGALRRLVVEQARSPGPRSAGAGARC